MPRRTALSSIAVAFTGDVPCEFRLFVAGVNETEKGPFLFDDEAARLVMAAQDAHGVDRMIDLEHLSLDTESRAFDPDARGWCRLELRPGPELWAVDVRWTDDGAARLTSKRQRYISPAFEVDDGDPPRVTKIVNIALTALPATHHTPALVAAHTRKTSMNHPMVISLRRRFDSAKKLADGEGEGGGKGAAVKEALASAMTALEELDKAISGGDLDTVLTAIEAAKKAVDAFENAANAMTGAPPDADAANTREGDTSGGDKALERMAAERAELVALRRDKAERELNARVEKLAAEKVERHKLVAELVKLGYETPATAWADDAATTPRGFLASMPLADLRERVKVLSGAPRTGGFVPPAQGSGPVVSATDNGAGMSEFEARRVRLAAQAELDRKTPGARPIDEVLERYRAHKTQALRGAKTHEESKRFGRPLDARDVLLDVRAGVVTLASTPVQPIQEFGASSQRALEEFRLNYNTALAAMPKTWAEEIGDMLPGGSLKDTYPLNFSANKYVEKTAQNAPAVTSNNVDITVQKKHFFGGEQVELIRLVKGDFAYILSWGKLAERLARQRVFLRNRLVTTLLEAGTTGYWGSSTTLATGIDGQPFFSASHKVNPFDPTMKLRTSATWGNYQGTAAPLSAGNLTTEKNAFFSVAGPDGNELGYECDAILHPSALAETAKNLLTVQQIILDAAASLKSVSNVMGPATNPHYNSGLDLFRAPELAGSAVTADYYLISKAAIAAGLYPWVIAEDAAEEVRVWDETSDYYKTSGFIKYESHIYVNAALLYPHAIRLIKGT